LNEALTERTRLLEDVLDMRAAITPDELIALPNELVLRSVYGVA